MNTFMYIEKWQAINLKFMFTPHNSLNAFAGLCNLKSNPMK